MMEKQWLSVRFQMYVIINIHFMKQTIFFTMHIEFNVIALLCNLLFNIDKNICTLQSKYLLSQYCRIN